MWKARTDDIYYHCHRCGRDLRDDEVVVFTSSSYENPTPVCEYCLEDLVFGLDEYPRDPWADNGVSIHDFV